MANNPAPRSDSPLAALRPEADAPAGEEIAIRTPVVRIGQGAQNDITLDDDTVSTNHARLEYDAGAWRLTDLESRNGTYLEGVRLAPDVPTPLPEGALVAFGAVRFRFALAANADAAQARAQYVPPAAKTTALSERSGFRLPLWLVVLVVLVVAALIALFVLYGGDPAAVEPAVEAASIVLAPAPPAA